MSKNIENTESKLTHLAYEYIKTQARNSFFLLLSDCVERKNAASGDAPLSELPGKVSDIEKGISQFVTSLEKILENESGEKETAFWKCIQMKKELVEIYGHISRYISLLSLYVSPIADEIEIRRYRAENVGEKYVEFNMFYEDILAFLNSAEDENKKHSYMSQIFKCAPLKMARIKYESVLEASLKEAFKGQSKEAVLNSLMVFKRSCAPDSFEDFGKYFPPVKDFLEKNKLISSEELSEKELSEKYDAFLKNFEYLSKASDALSRLFNCLNSLIILFYLNFNMDKLTGKNPSYSDLYYSVCEILGNQREGLNKNVLIEAIMPLFDQYIEPLLDRANQINKEEFSFLGDSISVLEFSEDTKKLMFTENFIRDCFYENIDDAMYAFDYDTSAPVAEESFKEKEFKGFIEYMFEYFNSLPAKLRKNSMRNLLASLPVAMSETELVLYMKNAVDSSLSFESRVMILDKVGYVFENSGFELPDEEDDCGCGHHHHEHDDDCSCGHCH